MIGWAARRAAGDEIRQWERNDSNPLYLLLLPLVVILPLVMLVCWIGIKIQKSGYRPNWRAWLIAFGVMALAGMVIEAWTSPKTFHFGGAAALVIGLGVVVYVKPRRWARS